MAGYFAIAGQVALVAAFAVFLKYVGMGQGKRGKSTGIALIVLAMINVLTLWHYDADPLQFTIKCFKGQCPKSTKHQDEMNDSALLSAPETSGEKRTLPEKTVRGAEMPLLKETYEIDTTNELQVSNQNYPQGKVETGDIDDTIIELAVSQSGRLAAVESYDQGEVRLSAWDLKTGQKVREFAKGNIDLSSISWAGQESTLTVIEGMRTSNPTMVAFHLKSGEERLLFSASSAIGFVARDHDGNVDAVVYSGENYPSFVVGKRVEQQITFRPPIWKPYQIDDFGFFEEVDQQDNLSNLETQQQADQCSNTGSHAYDPVSKHLVWLGSEGCLLIWDIQTKKPYRIVKSVSQTRASASAFSKDGKLFARGVSNGTVEIFSTNSWELIRKIRAENDAVSDISFGRNGQILASVGGFDGEVKVWNVLTGELVQKIVHKEGYSIKSVELNDHSNRVISASNGVVSSPLN